MGFFWVVFSVPRAIKFVFLLFFLAGSGMLRLQCTMPSVSRDATTAGGRGGHEGGGEIYPLEVVVVTMVKERWTTRADMGKVLYWTKVRKTTAMTNFLFSLLFF